MTYTLKRHFLLGAVLMLFALGCRAEEKQPVDRVNPLMGTDSSYELSTGNTYPAIARPFGMNFWTPQTGKMGDGWQYTYQSHRLRGLKQTHQPSPWINDYGQFALLPTTGKPVFDEEQRASWFSHKAETVLPYYYKVYLADYDITAELSPTSRACLFRITYPQTDSAWLVVDAFDKGSAIRMDREHNRIVGYTTKNSGGVPEGFRNYFVLEFSQPIAECIIVENGEFKPEKTSTETDHAGCLVRFNTVNSREVLVRTASSFIDETQALRNLEETGGWDFDALLAEGRAEWNRMLGRIEVSGASEEEQNTFYSCLYRCLLFPRSFYEIGADGQPYHYSPYNGEVLPGYLFTDTGFWDTFRSLFPLLNLVYPSVAEKMQAGLVCTYNESGFLPEWASPGHRGCMVGNNSASVVADAYVKGLRGYDAERLWQAVVHGANAVHPTVNSTGRLGFEPYNRLGYVPYDIGINESVARTLEYAYDDWCIYQFGRALGKKEKELRPFAQRALNYRNVFDKEASLMRGRNQDGTFQQPYNPLKWGDAFTEGNAWHWTWCVFHDPQGLINLMGGTAKFNQMMDSVFALPPVFDDSYYGFTIHEIREMQVMNMGNYAHGNQPIQHMIYLYNYSAQPWKAQQRVREVMRRFYTPLPDGYCGDEDNGQTSAWYVFSALGFYPVCPGSNEYVVGSPLFRHAVVHLENGNDITIEAPENSTENVYINELSLDGQAYERNYFTHEALLHGPTLRFGMAPQPNRHRGTAPTALPYSFSKP